MNSRSNLAYDSRIGIAYPTAAPQKSSNVRIRVSKKEQRTAQKRARALGIFKILFVMCCAFVVLYRGLIITDQCNAVNQKKAELNALIASNEKLQFEIDRSLDLKKVESIAQNDLGMRRAEKYQTIYINLDQVDYVEKVAEHEFSAGSKIAEFFAGLMEYLD